MADTKICILGYGKMGQAVKSSAEESNLTISKIITSKNRMEDMNFTENEVVIDFTNADAFQKNIRILTEAKVPVVCGTTGWYDNISDIRQMVKKNNSAFIYASNFSIGVHLFWKVIKHASEMINNFEEYDVMGYELHHKHKKDSPSGTALTTGNILLNCIKRKNKLITETLHRPLKQSEIQFASVRGGNVFGMHKVIFDSPTDTLQISHSSKNRLGFAKGAIAAAQWLQHKKGFFTIDDLIENS